MATIWEETKAQGAKLKGKPLKEKFAYFWEYYKTTTALVIVFLAILISVIHAFVTAKDYALSIVMINAVSPDINEDYSDWKSDLTEILDFNTKKYEVSVDTSVSLGGSSNSANSEYASLQKLAALFSSQGIDILIGNTAQIEHYAQLGYYHNLKEILPDDLYSKLESEGLIYYTDASTFSDYDMDGEVDVISLQQGYIVDHYSQESMKSPVPVGIKITDSRPIADKSIYVYLMASDDFQGHPEDVILSIPANTPRLDAAITAVEYFTAG